MDVDAGGGASCGSAPGAFTGPSPEQALRDSEPSDPASCSKLDCDVAACSAPSGAAPEPSAAQALHGHQTHGPQEVVMDGIQLAAQPVAEIGPLVVTAPPWRFLNVVSARMFLLVLRNPRDPTRGLTLMTNTSSQALVQTAQGIMSALAEVDGQMLGSLWDQDTYDELSGSNALLSALAEAVQQSGAMGVQALLGSSSSSSSSSSSGSCPAPAAPPAPSAGAAAEAEPPAQEEGECPICYEPIRAGDAAMRCCGSGGAHHYFHAHCLQSWIRTCQGGRGGAASCPVCRGRLQFHGARLQQFLQSPGAATLSEDERSFLEQVSDGLRGRSDWGDMNTLEKAAYAGGIVAAAGWGFMLGYSHTQHRASNLLMVQSVPQEHQLAQNLGWVAGLLVRVIREAMKDRGEESSDRSRARRRRG